MASNTFAQAPTAATGGGVTSLSKTFPSACTNGSVIVAAGTTEDTGFTIDITDNGGGSYTSRVLADNTSHAVAGISDTANTSTSTVQVTATFKVGGSPTTINFGTLQLYEITNSGGSPAFDAQNKQTGTVNNTAVSVAVLTTAANDSIISCGADNQATSWTAVDSGYTQRLASTAGTFSFHSVEDNVDVGASGTKTLTWGSHTGKFAVAAAAYKPPAGGGGGGSAIRLLLSSSLSGVGSGGVFLGDRLQ